MSGNRYFDDFRIPPDSPLLQYLDIKPGRYYAKWDASSETLFLKKHNGKKGISINVTLDQLMMILMTVQSQRDKFTTEELKIIETIERKNSPPVQKGFQSHHVVPLEVCKRSKLVIQAKYHCGFDEDKPPNRLPLPVTFHRGSHPKYSSFVEGILEDEWSDLVKAIEEKDCPSVLEILNGAISYFRDQLQEMSKKGLCTINEMFPKY
jgi:hypothetical protein